MSDYWTIVSRVGKCVLDNMLHLGESKRLEGKLFL